MSTSRINNSFDRILSFISQSDVTQGSEFADAVPFSKFRHLWIAVHPPSITAHKIRYVPTINKFLDILFRLNFLNSHISNCLREFDEVTNSIASGHVALLEAAFSTYTRY